MSLYGLRLGKFPTLKSIN